MVIVVFALSSLLKKVRQYNRNKSMSRNKKFGLKHLFSMLSHMKLWTRRRVTNSRIEINHSIYLLAYLLTYLLTKFKKNIG